LTKLYIADGDVRKSRKIGDYLYIISNNRFDVPYYTFKEEADIDVDIENIIPKKIDITKTTDDSEKNLKIKGKTLPYKVIAGDVANCSDIEYALPDAETLKQFDFSPSYNIISILNINDVSEEVKTKVIA
jgi:methylthioribose-1-phosphate isomerase